MPRVAREIELGFPMHVTQRGNNRQNIFRDEEDKELYMRSFMHYKRLEHEERQVGSGRINIFAAASGKATGKS